MNERTTLDQLNYVIELALCQQDAASAVAALSLKAAHLDDLRTNPVKGESASTVLDYLTARITEPDVAAAVAAKDVRASFAMCEGKWFANGFSLGVGAPYGSATHVMDAPGSDDGQELTICSNRKTADGVPVWTVTKSGIRFHVEVANATFRPDSVAAA